jgi:hypothetical protein
MSRLLFLVLQSDEDNLRIRVRPNFFRSFGFMVAFTYLREQVEWRTQYSSGWRRHAGIYARVLCLQMHRMRIHQSKSLNQIAGHQASFTVKFLHIRIYYTCHVNKIPNHHRQFGAMTTCSSVTNSCHCNNGTSGRFRAASVFVSLPPTMGKKGKRAQAGEAQEADTGRWALATHVEKCVWVTCTAK